MPMCIITGASSGIGRATAIALSETDYFSAYSIIGRNLSALSEIKNRMISNNPKINVGVHDVDLACLDKIPDLIESIAKKTDDNISCLLNVAGYTDPQSLLTTSMDSFDYTYKVNVYAPFLMTRECVRYMKSNGGKILNVASTAGMTPRPGWLSYASSKAAVISMSQTLSEELAEYGIKVYCISPGRCATELRKKLAPDEDSSLIMQPEDVGDVICKLISPNENCLDGQNIVIRKKI